MDHGASIPTSGQSSSHSADQVALPPTSEPMAIVSQNPHASTSGPQGGSSKSRVVLDLIHPSSQLDTLKKRQHVPKCTQETTSSQLRSVGMKCKAVLVDTDHSVELDGSNQLNQGPAMGTFNFMSHRLTNAFAQRSHTSVVHTLLDDLESLLWVLTYFIWLKLPSQHEDSIFEALWMYRGTAVMGLSKSRFAQATSKGMHPRKHIPSDCKRLVSDGLRPLFKVAENASDELSTLIEVEEKWTSSEILLLCRRIVEEYEKVWFDPEVKAAFASVPV